MGFLRTFLIIFLCILFIPILILSNILTVISFSYNYESIQKNIGPITRNVLFENISNDKLNQGMINACINKADLDIWLIQIPCSEITKDKNKAFDNLVLYALNDFYYRDYNCGIIDCYTSIDQDPAKNGIIISKKTDQNLFKFFLLSILSIIILLLFYFFLFEKKTNFMIFWGTSFIIFSPVSLLIKPILKSMILEKLNGSDALPIDVEKINLLIDNIANILLDKSFLVIFIWFITGILLIIFGIILKNRKTEKEILKKSDENL